MKEYIVFSNGDLIAAVDSVKELRSWVNVGDYVYVNKSKSWYLLIMGRVSNNRFVWVSEKNVPKSLLLKLGLLT